jgi:dihydropteroate synthase
MPVAPVARSEWLTARGRLRFDRPLVVGILNATPDSFWDGGLHDRLDGALVRAEAIIAEGADAIDIGGESTRPGAQPISAAEERARVVPVVEALARRFPGTPLSVDTVKADVADAALDAGAAIVNDVSGLRLDERLGDVVAKRGAGLILMHSRGGVDRMASYETAEYGPDPVGDIARDLRAALARAHERGISDEGIVLDPGLGFSKRTEHSVAALAWLERIVALGYPVMVGPSRKRFIGDLGGGLDVSHRLEGTLAACIVALLHGARLFRVHDAGPVRRALDAAEAIRRAT